MGEICTGVYLYYSVFNGEIGILAWITATCGTLTGIRYYNFYDIYEKVDALTSTIMI